MESPLVLFEPLLRCPTTEVSRWLVQLTARVGWQKACVAMANKNARILWAVMTREQGFDARHVSEKPRAKLPAKCVAPAPSNPEACAA